jgi:hypothetical protein
MELEMYKALGKELQDYRRNYLNKNREMKPDVVVHTCNPSNLESGRIQVQGSRPAWGWGKGSKHLAGSHLNQ